MPKWGLVFRCLLLIYALGTLLYNVFAIYLPYAEQGYNIFYHYANLSTYDDLRILIHKPGIDYQTQCPNASIFTTRVELVAVEMVIFLNGTNDENKQPPNILPRVTVAYFWSGQMIMLLISILDCFMPCDKSKTTRTSPIYKYEFGRINGVLIQEEATENSSLTDKCCRFFVRSLMGAFKLIFVSTTYAIPVYVISMFDFSTPCLKMYYDKASVFGTWDLLIPYLTFFFVIAFSILECVLRCCLHKQMDYYDFFYALEKKICSRGGFILCCCIPVVNSALMLGTLGMILAFGFTSTLWYKALASHFPKAVALATLTFVRWPLQIIDTILNPCRN